MKIDFPQFSTDCERFTKTIMSKPIHHHLHCVCQASNLFKSILVMLPLTCPFENYALCVKQIG